MKRIFNVYKDFIDNLPKDLKRIDCKNGACGAFSLGLYEFFRKNNISCDIVELNSGLHYFIYAEDYSFDRYGYQKGLITPSKISTLKEHYNLLSYNKAYRKIIKKTFSKGKYIDEFCNYAKNYLIS